MDIARAQPIRAISVSGRNGRKIPALARKKFRCSYAGWELFIDFGRFGRTFCRLPRRVCRIGHC
jgi:hypothetical protein